MYEIPFMPFSYFPMNLHLLYMVPLYFGNDIIPKFIHFGFALLTAWLIFSYLQRRLSTTYGLLGVIFFLSVPIILKLSINVYVDLGLIFFSTASLLSLLRWMESGFQKRFLVVSAIFCGLAMGTKYNGLITFGLLTLFVPFVYSRYNRGGRPGFIDSAAQGLIFFFISVLLFSPWMVRNTYWKNNPIYPLYDNWFKRSKVEQTEIVAKGDSIKSSLGFFTKRSLLYHETWWEMALLPVRIFFQGKDGNPQFFDGRLNPFLLFLPIFSFFGIGKDPPGIQSEKKMLFAFAMLFFGFAFFTSALRIRYIAPIIPPLVILSVYGVKNMARIVVKLPNPFSQKAGLTAVFCLLSFFLLLNARYIVSQFRSVEPFGYIGGSVSREEYIENHVLEYPAIQYINKNVAPESRLLFIFLGKRGYYCDRDYTLNRGRLYRIVKESESPEQIFMKLRNMGITHLLIRYDILDKWKADEAIFDERELRILDEFMVEYLEILFYKWGYGVSRLEFSSS
jgi:hypothetical protein